MHLVGYYKDILLRLHIFRKTVDGQTCSKSENIHSLPTHSPVYRVHLYGCTVIWKSSIGRDITSELPQRHDKMDFLCL